MKLFAAMSSVIMSASLLFGATSAQAGQLESIQKMGVLKVAVPQDFPPFGSVGIDLKPQGYDIDMQDIWPKSSMSNLNWCLSPVLTEFLICKRGKWIW